MASMAMPKAAAHFYNYLSCSKYQVRSSRKIGTVNTKSVARAMEHRPHLLFRLCILATVRDHISVAADANSFEVVRGHTD